MKFLLFRSLMISDSAAVQKKKGKRKTELKKKTGTRNGGLNGRQNGGRNGGSHQTAFLRSITLFKSLSSSFFFSIAFDFFS